MVKMPVLMYIQFSPCVSRYFMLIWLPLKDFKANVLFLLLIIPSVPSGFKINLQPRSPKETAISTVLCKSEIKKSIGNVYQQSHLITNCILACIVGKSYIFRGVTNK